MPLPHLAGMLALATMLLVGGCGGSADDGPVAVSVIGTQPRLVNPARTDPSPAEAALLGVIAQGLVRFDDQAQIVPGLAIRWAISDDGLYYTFRLDRDGPDAEQVARALRLVVRFARSGPFGMAVDGIREIMAVTPEVIEIRLSRPCPGLITALASPSFAVLIDGKGMGPLVASGKIGRLTVLTPPHRTGAAETSPGRRPILLRGERVGVAVARFASGEASLVTGGTFTDIAYPRLAGIADPMVRMDPVTGLFGLRIAHATPLLMSIEVRQALSMALDRDAIGAALGISGWHSTQSILPAGLTDVPQPTVPIWAQALSAVARNGPTAQARVERARNTIRIWMQQHKQIVPPVIRIAMPDGPGSSRLFRLIAAQWNAVGVAVRRMRYGESADMRLIDEIAPVDQADWFLAHFTCDAGPPCNQQADRALKTALSATNPAVRTRGLADAEQRLTAITPFIPIAQPIRWSLAAPTLAGFKTNPRAAHPLSLLIAPGGTK
jgi:oligopeptide transport system substrate-binding protein